MREQIVFTGSLASMNREQAQSLATALGNQCPSTVTRETTILVIGTSKSNLFEEKESIKKQVAAKLIAEGQPIQRFTEKEFLQLMITELTKRRKNI